MKNQNLIFANQFKKKINYNALIKKAEKQFNNYVAFLVLAISTLIISIIFYNDILLAISGLISFTLIILANLKDMQIKILKK